MALKFNPLTGNFDFTGSGGGGASYIDGEVAVYADLSLSSATAPLDSAWLVRTASGVWPVSRKQAGIYIRTATAGSSRDADYTYAGTMPDVFSDAQFTVYDDADTSKNLQFQLSGLTTATTRTLTVPNASGRIQIEGQAIGDTTPAAGSFTSLTSRNLTGDPELLTLFSQFGDTKFYGTHFTIPNINLLDSTDLYLVRGGGKVAVGPYTAAPTARLQVNGNVAANNGTLTASAPVLDLAQTWNNAAVTFTGLKFNVTNTASNANSLSLDIQSGGSSVFTVRRDGTTGGGLFAIGATWLGNTLYNGGIMLTSGSEVAWANNSANVYNTLDVRLARDAADTLAQRRTTNAQTFRLYNTYTDASNYERGFMRWSSNVLEIGTEGAGTGTATRELRLFCGTNEGIRIQSNAVLIKRTAFYISNASITNGTGADDELGTSLNLRPFSTGNVIINNGLIKFHGTTSSFPALKRSTTVLQARLADDSAFAPLQGQLRIHQNAVAETPTATHTMTLFDAAGTAYRVLCVV